MKSLTESPLEELLADDEIIKREVEAGAVKNGYQVIYYLGNVAYTFRGLDNHLVVDFMINEGAKHNQEAIRIFEQGEAEEAKKFCYTKIIEYLTENCKIVNGKIWPKLFVNRKL
jgi:hypothetical protein